MQAPSAPNPHEVPTTVGLAPSLHRHSCVEQSSIDEMGNNKVLFLGLRNRFSFTPHWGVIGVNRSAGSRLGVLRRSVTGREPWFSALRKRAGAKRCVPLAHSHSRCSSRLFKSQSCYKRKRLRPEIFWFRLDPFFRFECLDLWLTAGGGQL